MSEMVERVARTLHKVGDDRSEPGFRVPWADCAPKYQQYMRESASAAIEAMREPTEAMLGAGFERMDFDDSMSGDAFNRRVAGRVFDAMIAAALATPDTREDET